MAVRLRLAGLRAAAAHNLLAAAILQQQVDVVQWLLDRLGQMTADGSWVEQCLVSQQRSAWGTAGRWVPLLVLVAVSGEVHCSKVGRAAPTVPLSMLLD